jgi:hypothetical protein
VITVVVDPSSRLTFVIVVSAFPVCDFVTVVSAFPVCDVEVVDEADPALSGNTMVVPDDGASGVCAATGSGDSKARPSSGVKSFIFNQRFGRHFVRWLAAYWLTW